MANIIKGADVAASMENKLLLEIDRLKQKKIDPKLGIVRMGARTDDIAYERGVLKRFEKLGITVQVFNFQFQENKIQESINQENKNQESFLSEFLSGFLSEFEKINNATDIHGILLFRPLPLDQKVEQKVEKAIIKLIDPRKDVDCMSPLNVAKIFAGEHDGFAPCTPSAVMEILDYAGVSLNGKNVAIIGRSMVVGRPLAMLMLGRNATVTICHTKTRDIEKICSAADIIIAAAGKAHILTPAFVSEKSIVIDVGININNEGKNEGKICGDVDYDAVSPLVSMITPVPGGVGSVTTSVLAKHVLKAAALIHGL